AFAFQNPELPSAGKADDIRLMEAGLAATSSIPAPFQLMDQRNYAGALTAMTPGIRERQPWLPADLEQRVDGLEDLKPPETPHFTIYTPPDQEFLAIYAGETLEKVGDTIEKRLGHRPNHKVTVEIYPTRESFSAASTLSLETLERSGAIGICKFHRLMIMTP